MDRVGSDLHVRIPDDKSRDRLDEWKFAWEVAHEERLTWAEFLVLLANDKKFWPRGKA